MMMEAEDEETGLVMLVEMKILLLHSAFVAIHSSFA